MSSSPPPPMDLPTFSVGGDDPVAAPFEWSEFLDLAFDDQLFLPLEDSSNRQVEEPAELPPPPAPPQPEEEEADAVEPLSDRVRKRDPRLVCSNFLAGIVPCACPEMDAKMAEQEEKEAGGPWKKRVRVARGAKARCQVPDCTADISELKGYHRRHRVCLACANATSVVLDGESKRYCQQCGKFHILSDFDEGKRSCRRKLERHNNRRRRKPIDSRGAADKEPQLNLLGEDIFSDEESGKGNLCSTSQSTEGDVLQVSNGGNTPNLFSGPDSKVMLSDSGVTFTASGETPVDGGNDDSKYALSPYYDSKNGYSSVCPTGRISFKLYDWNPAEFPRRLRLQIFQWLASMPVELEGYIRPGCTILTAFISMPQFMWVKLFEDPASYVHNFLAPGRALSGKGTALVYVNNKVFRILRDGMSVVEANVAKLAPKVHYVHPSCFEAGKPMEFIVCGRNLFQPNFRSLVSFAGKYLDHEYSVAFPSEKINAETSMSFDHQFCRICVRFTESTFYGPAFIEIENESGLSNFMPIIICDEQVCSEIKMIQDKHNSSFEVTPCIEAGEPPHYTRQAACLGQPIFSNFMLDLAWLLKQPAAEKLQQEPTSSEIQRFGHLLSFLVRHDSVYILNRILGHMEAVADQAEDNITNRVVDTDRKFLQEQFDQARKFLCQKLEIDCHASTSVQKGNQFSYKFFEDDAVTIVPIEQKDLDIRAERNLITSECSTSTLKDQTTPLLNKEVAVDMVDMKHQLKESRSPIRSRPSILVMVAFAVCFGVCTVLLHPSHVSRIVVSVKSCLFEYSP